MPYPEKNIKGSLDKWPAAKWINFDNLINLSEVSLPEDDVGDKPNSDGTCTSTKKQYRGTLKEPDADASKGEKHNDIAVLNLVPFIMPEESPVEDAFPTIREAALMLYGHSDP